MLQLCALSATDYIVPSSCLPCGFDTLASFVAKEHPDILDWLIELAPPVQAFVLDEDALTGLSATYGLEIHRVPAAAAYRAAGAETQPAFQIGLLVAMVATDFSLGARLRRRAGN